MNEETRPHIFKLNIPCFEDLFAWLSVFDLVALRQTCKRFKQIADHYIKEFHPAVKFGRDSLNVTEESIDQFRHLDPNLAKLVNKVTFWGVKLNDADIDDLKGILNHIKVLNGIGLKIFGDFYESVLKFCPNLTHLSILSRGNPMIGSDERWLHREYPKLENVKFDYAMEMTAIGWKYAELKTFFELNPNIRTFSTSFCFLWVNRGWLVGSKMQFDVLHIKGCPAHNSCETIKTLYDQGFYKRLHLRGIDINSDADWNLITALPAVEVLHLSKLNVPVVLSPMMTSVKELHYHGHKDPVRLAHNLLNVECVDVLHSEFTEILPFVRHSAKLKEINVSFLDEGLYFENNIVDVAALNREREHLAGACKLTIYVEDEYFLATKWAGKPLDCSLVELKRNTAWKRQY